MAVSLRLLQYVVAAADCGHVTRAAKQLNVSQPSISSAIAELEATVGVRLFIRHHARGIALTPAGERLIKEARLLLKHAHDFTQSAQQLGAALKGEIEIGCFHTLAVRFMPALLARFAEIHPGISVMLHEGDQEEIMQMLLSGRIELALAYRLAVPDEIHAEPLGELPPYAIVSSTHRLARRKQVRLRELADDPFLLLDLPASRDYFFDLFRSANVNPRIIFRSRSQELIRGLVAHGYGFAIHNAIPGTNVTYDGSRVAVLALERGLQHVEITSLRLAQHGSRPAVQAFADFLREAFGPKGQFAPGSITPPRIDAVERLPP